jgi:hypothetical protein
MGYHYVPAFCYYQFTNFMTFEPHSPSIALSLISIILSEKHYPGFLKQGFMPPKFKGLTMVSCRSFSLPSPLN